MSELQITTIDFKPAVVSFNFAQLSQHLESELQKYRNLVFDDKSAKDCKKTLAELRKGKKELDDYRKDIKKKLTESVTAFENQCKELANKFDDVISPLSDQYDQFEHNRKETKRTEIQEIIDRLIAEQGLVEKFSSQLIIPDEYFNVGKSIKDIKTELTALASSLGIAQDKEAADVEIIKSKVELANAKNQLTIGLVDTAYIKLLEHWSINSIVEQINADADVIKQREVEAESKRQPAVQTAPIVAPPSKSTSTEIFKESYEVSGTEEQLDALENFLRTNGYTWEILE